jgi:hypothetical protein
MIANPVGGAPEQSTEEPVVASIPEDNEIEPSFIRTLHDLLGGMSPPACDFNRAGSRSNQPLHLLLYCCEIGLGRLFFHGDFIHGLWKMGQGFSHP